jgi:hypothetical protein
MTMPTSGVITHSAEVYNSAQTDSYGKAKIESSYWFNSANNYWYYAYKVYNNEVAGGTPYLRSNDYHFGHVYDLGYTPINLFDIALPIEIPRITGEELVVTTRAPDLIAGERVSTYSGSSSGGGGWGGIAKFRIDMATGKEYFVAVDWSQTLGDVTASPINPTQWDYPTTGPNKNTWVKTYSGDTSRVDSGSYEYFQIASKLAPGLVAGHVTTGLISSNFTVSGGEIWGPAVIVPEPATIAILALGGLLLKRRK